MIRAGETANVVGVWSGDAEGNGDSVGLDEGDGEAVDAWSAKFAHGCGGTLAHSLCTPRASPANGLTLVLKLPLASAVAEPATLFGWSQYRVTASFGRNWPPLTLMTVFEPPAVTSSERKALTGVGVGQETPLLGWHWAMTGLRVRGETTVRAAARATAPNTTTTG